MPSKFANAPKEAYVWIWLSGETNPVVAGNLEAHGDEIQFNYGKSYLERVNDEKQAISIYAPELLLEN
ncbi:serine/threonine-protein kinase HipA [Alteromonadaceae bacterium 2753L.S.0a.02]|nr:serine/threonine-protein kinase HipA [Alteromonadaceae bacterium 2753L.S.0a.02]